MYSYKESRKETYANADKMSGRGYVPPERHHRYEQRRRREGYHHSSPPRGIKDVVVRGIARDEPYHHKDYKERWSRYENSRSRSPVSEYQEPVIRSEADSEMEGLIFMCNKKTTRRCLEYNVLGMPMAKKPFAEKLVPGMKVFLFEFESRELHGVFEATCFPGIDLEPKAFVDAEISFPIQVRFRVVEKCSPLREFQFKEAIIGNYFEANRFRFDLTRDQVHKLLDLFLPNEHPYRSLDSPRKSQYGPSFRRHNHRRQRGYQSNRMYRKEEEWKDERESFLERPGDNREDYEVDYANNHNEYREPASTAGYEPDYKLGKHSKHEPDGWPLTARDSGYNGFIDSVPSAQASGSIYVAPSGGPYAAASTGYTLGNSFSEADRYWKTSEATLQTPGEPYAAKPTLYARPVYDTGLSMQRPLSLDPADDVTLRLAGKRHLVSDVEYLPIPVAPSGQFQLSHSVVGGKELEYGAVPAYEIRRVPVGYAGDGVDPLLKQHTRYGASNGLLVPRDGAGFIPSDRTTISGRYPREPSPKVPEARYVGGPYTYIKSGYGEPSTVTAERGFEFQPPASKSDYGPPYSPGRLEHRKTSVWDRVSGIPGSRRWYNKDYDSSRSGYKRTREMSEESDSGFNYPTAKYPCAEEEGGFFDFKRRSKNNERHGVATSSLQRRRFVRPDVQYADRTEPGG